ncbi:MAG: DUF1800 domain-containing protein [Bacteroidia bacterium]|nr:DUF1800 domain-containing protein [Bacteroidia bacterium]
MDRRSFLSLSFQDVLTEPGYGEGASLSASSLTPYSGQWTDKEVKHLLRRTQFGAPKAEIVYFRSLGCSASVDTLLERINHPAYTPPAPPVNHYYNDAQDPLVGPEQPWPGTADTEGPGNISIRRREGLKAWWVGLMINQPRSLREKMTLFWYNHFVIEMRVVSQSTFCYNYLQMLRANALGNFKTLTREVTISAAMLNYLNGDSSTASAPNENYARELQELFTIGKDANGQSLYTEDDVVAAARVLTGWTNDLVNGVSANGYLSVFDPARHDTGSKTFSSFYSNRVITGRAGASGAQEVDDLLDMIFARNDVALFICRKLYRFFVYYKIDATTETNVIQPLAAILRQNNYDISAALSTLFKSEHFFDMLSQGCVIKPPIDFVVGLCRDFNANLPATATVPSKYAFWSSIVDQAGRMQQDIGDPPSVAGWPMYYQAPMFHEMWINTDTLPRRNKVSDEMAGNAQTTGGLGVNIDVVGYTATMNNPSDPVALIDEVLRLHYFFDASPSVINYLLNILLSGQTQTYYWSDAWDNYMNDPTNPTYYGTVKSRLQTFYRYIMDLSEYQLS